MNEFIKDCLNVKMTLHDVATKWGMTINEVANRYVKEKQQMTDAEFNQLMDEPIAYKITMLNDATHYVKYYKYIDDNHIVTYPHKRVFERDMIKRIEVM